MKYITGEIIKQINLTEEVVLEIGEKVTFMLSLKRQGKINIKHNGKLYFNIPGEFVIVKN